MDTTINKALGHKTLNLFQVEMFLVKQDSELFIDIPNETPNLGEGTPDIFIKDENLLYRIQQFNEQAKIGVMNFADPYTPGGHFMDGVAGQEQMLCRDSYLYPELRKFIQTYYFENAQDPQGYLIQPAVINSHHIKVLRDEKENRILSKFRYIDVVSTAAPDIREMKAKGIVPDQAKIYANLSEKILRTLRVFKLNGDRELILGAFGCGYLQNDPQMVATIFKECLDRTEFLGCFDHIYFDIWHNPSVLQTFAKILL